MNFNDLIFQIRKLSCLSNNKKERYSLYILAKMTEKNGLLSTKDFNNFLQKLKKLKQNSTTNQIKNSLINIIEVLENKGIIEMNENQLVILKVKPMEMKGVYMNEPYDYDLYEIVARVTPFVTREINVVVDFTDKTLSGDMVACGSWDALEQDTILKILKQLTEMNQIQRPVEFIKL